MKQFIIERLADIKSHWQFIVASGSMFIALITYCDSRTNRRLSARPCLEVLREFDTVNENIGIILSNHSSAVGIIDDIVVTVGDKIVRNNRKIRYLDDAINQLKFSFPHHFSLRHMSKGSFIAPGKEMWIIKTSIKNLTIEDKKELLFELDKIIIDVTYKSIYKEKFIAKMGEKMFENNEEIQKSV